MDLQAVWILHTRPFRSSSLLIELFSRSQGRLSVVANSARGPKSRYKGILQPFRQLLVDWSGKRELKTLGHVELMGLPYRLQGMRLFCAYYLNELLMHLLAKDDPYERVYDAYLQTLVYLQDAKQDVELCLRRFERCLLIELGYGLAFDHDASTQSTIAPDTYYSLMAERGFFPVSDVQQDQAMVFKGQHLLAIASDDYSDQLVRADAKRIMRYLIGYQLGNKPLHSRELIKAML